jgi:hypothetical protein
MWQIDGAILGHYFKVKSTGIDHFVENHFAESHIFDQKSPMESLRQSLKPVLLKLEITYGSF